MAIGAEEARQREEERKRLDPKREKGLLCSSGCSSGPWEYGPAFLPLRSQCVHKLDVRCFGT